MRMAGILRMVWHKGESTLATLGNLGRAAVGPFISVYGPSGNPGALDLPETALLEDATANGTGLGQEHLLDRVPRYSFHVGMR